LNGTIFSIPIVDLFVQVERDSFLDKELFVSRVARFFLVLHTKTGGNIPNYNKIYLPNGRKIDQTAIKCTNSSYCKTIPNLPKIGDLGFENKPSGNPACVPFFCITKTNCTIGDFAANTDYGKEHFIQKSFHLKKKSAKNPRFPEANLKFRFSFYNFKRFRILQKYYFFLYYKMVGKLLNFAIWVKYFTKLANF
jgi:hypothetical protein